MHELEQQVERDTGQRPLVAGMSKWSIAAGLAFYDADGRRDNVTSRNIVGRTGAMFEYWFDDQSDGHRPVAGIVKLFLLDQYRRCRARPEEGRGDAGALFITTPAPAEPLDG